MKRGTVRGAIRLFDAALQKLASLPDGFENVNRKDAVDAARRHRMRIADGGAIDAREYPKLTMVRT